MSKLPRRILIVQVAALGYEFLRENQASCRIAGLSFKPLQSIFPAVTCSIQASFRTASYPKKHGMVGNGFFSREWHRVYFWEQSSDLYHGSRIWRKFRENGGRVGQFFWQQSLGQDSDMILSPAPIHKHSGGMIQDCFSEPSHLYTEIKEELGRPFNLIHYWGPLASRKGSEWIVDASSAVMQRPDAPELLLTYLPHLDYELQKSGPASSKSKAVFQTLTTLLERLLTQAFDCGYHVLLFGDYAISMVHEAIFPNRILLEAGLMKAREIKGRSYPNLHTSPAFAVVDHQIAHVICNDDKTTASAKAAFTRILGIEAIFDKTKQARKKIDHPRSGELILLAEPGYWFAYPWWTDSRMAPDFSSHIDIHNKPGYDPCELFFSGLPLWISQDTRKINGSHGRIGKGLEVAYASNLPMDFEFETIVDLAGALRDILHRMK